MDTKTSDFGGAVRLCGFVDKARTNDEIGFVLGNGLNEFFNVAGIVLAVSIELNGNIVTIFVGIFVASLDSATDTKISKKINIIIGIAFKDLLCGISGAVVNYDIIVISFQNRVDSIYDSFFFVVGRNNNENF